jgi:arginase
MKTAARKAGRGFFSEFPSRHIPDANEVLDAPPKMPFAHHVEALVSIYDQLAGTVADVLLEGNFPICLTGDHSTGGALVAGIKRAFPDQRLGVIWVDAHADLHSPYTTPSGNMHGMPLAIALDVDNLEHQRNNPHPQTRALWEELQAMGGIQPMVQPQDLVFVGLRSYEAEEAYLIREHEIRHYGVEASRRQGMKAVARQILEELSACDQLFVSFDVDSMDPVLVGDGTGTPVSGGFTEEEARMLLHGLLRDPRVVAFELTEMNPTLDTGGNRMGEAAFRLLERSAAVLQGKAADLRSVEG